MTPLPSLPADWFVASYTKIPFLTIPKVTKIPGMEIKTRELRDDVELPSFLLSTHKTSFRKSVELLYASPYLYCTERKNHPELRLWRRKDGVLRGMLRLLVLL